MLESKKAIITNKKERKRVYLSLAVLIIISAIIVYLMNSGFSSINFRTLRELRGATGQFAAYGFGFVIAMYAIRRLVKHITSKEIKMKLLSVARFAREWHAPVAIGAFAVILLHVYIILSKGFFLDLRYISGLLAFIVLCIQMLSGILRYKKIGVKFHMILGVSFTILMFIHLMA